MRFTYLSLRKDKHLLLVCIYDLSLNTEAFYKYLLNTTVHCKELSGLINLRPDLGFWCQTRMKQITLDTLDQKTFSCYTKKWRMTFTPLLLPSSHLSHPPKTMMNYKLYLHVGSKRSFENTTHKYSLKAQKSQTIKVFHIETCFP